jgi:hypothetical protein
MVRARSSQYALDFPQAGVGDGVGVEVSVVVAPTRRESSARAAGEAPGVCPGEGLSAGGDGVGDSTGNGGVGETDGVGVFDGVSVGIASPDVGTGVSVASEGTAEAVDLPITVRPAAANSTAETPKTIRLRG